MKIYTTHPDKPQFFNRYASLVPTLYQIGIIAQVISFLTEIGVIYAIAWSAVHDFSPTLAPWLAAIGALTGALFLEIGLRQFVPYGIRAIIYRRVKGIDLAMSITIWMTALGLLVTSGLLSFKGSRNMVAAVAPAAKQKQEAPVKKSWQEKEAQITTQYQQDRKDLEGQQQVGVKALQQEYAGRIAIENERLDYYRKLEARKGNSYHTTRSRLKQKVHQLETERDAAIRQFLTDHQQDAEALKAKRDQQIATAQAAFETERNRIQAFNHNAQQSRERMVQKYGWGMGGFTLVCLCIFVLSAAIYELHHKGSGIEQRIIPGPYYFDQSLIPAFFNAWGQRWHNRLRHWVHRIEAGSRIPLPPSAPPPVFDMSEWQIQRSTVNSNGSPSTQQRIRLVNPTSSQVYAGIQDNHDVKTGATESESGPEIQIESTVNQTYTPQSETSSPANDLEQKALNYIRASLALFKANLEAQALEMQLKAEDVIGAYLGEAANEKSIAEWRKAIADFLTGKGENPFIRKATRQPIGFAVQGEKSLRNATATNACVTAPTKHCIHCGTVYTPTVNWQKFCQKECRLAYHEEQHGQKFNPHLYQKRKR